MKRMTRTFMDPRTRALTSLFSHAQRIWGWGSDEYADVEEAVDVVLKAVLIYPVTDEMVERAASAIGEALFELSLSYDGIGSIADLERRNLARAALSAAFNASTSERSERHEP